MITFQRVNKWFGTLHVLRDVAASLASIIGMMELTKAAQTVSQREIRPFEMYLFIAVVYWICTYSMSRLSRWLEVKMSPEQTPTQPAAPHQASPFWRR